MKEKLITVSNKMGLHARPAALLVQTTSRFKSSVKILKDDFEVDAKSIMGVMTLAAASGYELKFVADGPDENEVLDAVEKLFNNGFNE
ncbi:MAG: HPr family phosphocarrier protein [Endomicrobia bacterium]|nr:HPr family phosphocarrier protein [Endomicrobiia bacterium]MCL2507238.1 HPr family phosphocarrier protein [Endomicrobiia bacterium]